MKRFAIIAGVKISLIAQIYYLLKTLDSYEVKLSELHAAQRINEDAYDNLWFGEEIEKYQKKIEKIKLLMQELVKQL